MDNNNIPPALRSDLVLYPWQSNNTNGFLLEDPRTGRTFTFKTREFTIIKLLDGIASLQDITRHASEETGATLSRATVTKFVNRLNELGLLEQEVPIQTPGSSSRTLPKGQFDVSLVRYMRPLRFTATFLFSRISGSIIGAIIFVMLVYEALFWHTAYVHDLQYFFSWPYVPLTFVLIYLCFPPILFIHELGHELASLSFTGKLYPMRVFARQARATVILPPAVIWSLPGRTQRVIIALAGLYSEIAILVLAALLWRVAGSVQFIAQLYVSASISLIGSCAINILPTLPALANRKTDGYFAASYLLAIPNLSMRAKACSRWRRQSELMNPPPAWLVSLTPFQRRALAFYTVVMPWVCLAFLAVIFWAVSSSILWPIPSTGAVVTLIIALWLIAPYAWLGLRLAFFRNRSAVATDAAF